MRRALFLCAVLASAPSLVAGQGGGTVPDAHATAALGAVSLRILDEFGHPTPARVRVTDESGLVTALPPQAVSVMYGMWDHADGYGYQPDSSFYVAGHLSQSLPEGRYHVVVSKGHEYLAQRTSIDVVAGDTARRVLQLDRWIDMPARGWYSSDGHIHVRRSPREDSLLLVWTQAEDIHVGVMLRMGDFWEVYYAQYAWGQDGVYQRGEYLLTSGQEDPRTPELGHALGMGMSDRVRDRDAYYLYDRVFDRIRELEGVAGYAHHAHTFHGYRGLVLDGVRGKVDILELLQFCAPEGPLIIDHYYHLLDLGFPLTAVAGSDFPWCGRDHRYGEAVPLDRAAQIGNARFYVHVDDSLTYRSWKDALRSGRTFVSSGPVLDLRVDGERPGGRIDAGRGDSVEVVVEVRGHPEQVPLEFVEIVSHGLVLMRTDHDDIGQSRERIFVSLSVPVEGGRWIAARAGAGRYQMAHTTPVYVTVEDGGFHNMHTLTSYLRLSEEYLLELERLIAEPTHDPERQAWKYRDELQSRIDETREVVRRLRHHAAQ